MVVEVARYLANERNQRLSGVGRTAKAKSMNTLLFWRQEAIHAASAFKGKGGGISASVPASGSSKAPPCLS